MEIYSISSLWTFNIPSGIGGDVITGSPAWSAFRVQFYTFKSLQRDKGTSFYFQLKVEIFVSSLKAISRNLCVIIFVSSLKLYREIVVSFSIENTSLCTICVPFLFLNETEIVALVRNVKYYQNCSVIIWTQLYK